MVPSGIWGLLSEHRDIPAEVMWKFSGFPLRVPDLELCCVAAVSCRQDRDMEVMGIAGRVTHGCC